MKYVISLIQDQMNNQNKEDVSSFDVKSYSTFEELKELNNSLDDENLFKNMVNILDTTPQWYLKYVSKMFSVWN